MLVHRRSALAALALLALTALMPAPALAQLIDINSASPAALEALHGIGPVRAAAIIKGRPYRGKDELVKRNIIPQNVYDGIKDKIIAHQTPTPAKAKTKTK
jgi:DNA uptake protein ComE-like DNA-binding protein